MTTTLLPTHELLVAGRPTPVARELAVTDPASDAEIARVADADAGHALQAADAAADALPRWAATAPRRRSEILAAAHRLMIERTVSLAALVSRESGKSTPDAVAEIGYAAEFLRWFAEEAVRSDGSFGASPDGRGLNVVTAHPVGVALLITPWNFPAAMVTRKIAPALAAGCTAVLKPAAETPLTALAIRDVLVEAGAPEDVLTVLPTSRPGEVATALLGHRAVRKLSFTGSTSVGRLLLRQAADRVVNCSMELGGNAPFVVCADADIEAAVAGAMTAKLRNAGQACTAANRFLVHAAVADEFVEAFAAAVVGQRVGPADDAASTIGPLIDHRSARRVSALVDDAVRAGAVPAHEPAALPATGSFVAPLVLRDVPAGSPLGDEEIFGPVAPVTTWTDPEEMVRIANATEYGLAGYLYTRDNRAGLDLARALQCGMVGLNRGVVSDPSAPFGGMKQSGLSREGAREGIRAFQEPQFLSVG